MSTLLKANPKLALVIGAVTAARPGLKLNDCEASLTPKRYPVTVTVQATDGSFTTTLDLDPSERANLSWDVKSMPETTIYQGAQTQQVVVFEAKRVFEKAPTVRISYLAGALQALTLKLPVVIHKFMDQAELSADDFFKRWKQIGGAPREAQRIFGLSGPKDGEREITENFIRQVLEGFRWGLLYNVDPNSKNFVGASVVHTSEGGKFGCLMRLEPNYGTQVSFSFFSFLSLSLSLSIQLLRMR